MYTGKTGSGGRAREVPSPFPLPPSSLLSRFPPLVSPLFLFFVNFSPALYCLNAWNRLRVAALTCCVHSNDCRIWLNSIKSSLKILIIKMKVVIPSLTSSEHPRFVSDKKENSLRKQLPPRRRNVPSGEERGQTTVFAFEEVTLSKILKR